MATHRIRYLTVRRAKSGDRYFWQPSKALARQRWKLTRLADTAHVARCQAGWINAILDAWRMNDPDLVHRLLAAWAEGGTGSNELAPAPFISVEVPGFDGVRLSSRSGVKTLQTLVDAFKESEEWHDLAEKTRREYGYHMAPLMKWAGDIPVHKIGRKRIRDYHKAVRKAVSLSTANARLRVLSLLLSFAVNEEVYGLSANPALRLKMKGTPPRVVIWTVEEENLLIALCDRRGRPDIADMIVGAADLGQRRQDLIDLSEEQFDGERFRLRTGKGRRHGIICYPHASSRLLARMAAASARRAARNPAIANAGRHIFLNEETGKPWAGSTFAHELKKLRDEAAKELPALARKEFRDLRDTFVTRAAVGGATLAQIRTATGHTMASIQRVIEHYLGSEPEMAAATASNLTALLKQIEAEQKVA